MGGAPMPWPGPVRPQRGEKGSGKRVFISTSLRDICFPLLGGKEIDSYADRAGGGDVKDRDGRPSFQGRTNGVRCGFGLA